MNINEVQRRLWEQSRTHRENQVSETPLFPSNPYDLRVRKLMDLMHNPIWLSEAAHRVMKRSYGKAPGVDGVTVKEFRSGFERRVEELRLELKRGNYQPQPVRQVMIPKANGKMRALGIPCLRDKIVQEAMRMALEPIFEVDFHENSYGFRPNRNTHQAVHRCQHLMKLKFTWVIEGDVKACFDEISHKAILKVLREKVHDNKFLDLIKRFLKAGVEVDGVVKPTVKGVPQGGVISPLLANTVLNKLDWYLHSKGKYGKQAEKRCWDVKQPNIRFVRYADDWCVFVTRASKRYVSGLRDSIGKFLETECGLSLSMEKTHITHVRDGFSFLGFDLKLTVGRNGNLVPKIRIGTKAKQQLQLRLNEAMRYRPHQESIALRIKRGSAVVRGWANYYCIAYNYPALTSTLDHWAFWIAVKAISRKLDIRAAKVLKRYYRQSTIVVSEDCKLERFRSTSIRLYISKPEPYHPEDANSYETDEEIEASFHKFNERGRFGQWDSKHEALKRGNYCCQICGAKVTAEISHADHIEPVKSFANFQMANSNGNVQTLCHECHKNKHRGN